jgi:polar amino acid transport system substrate-binding protein
VALSTGTYAQSKTVTLTSLEWPPYTSESLAQLGASSAVATAAFKAMGYDLKIEFYPWNRAVLYAKTDPKYIGYFPEYYSKENEADFLYSAPMGTGPLGFVERKDSPVKWQSLNDLKPLTIGVVNGYINTAEFDEMVSAKKLKVDGVVDDNTNVVKVANKRIPLAVIDPNVLNYLVYHDKVIIPYRDVVQFNAKTLELKSLYVCFKKGAEGQKWAAIYNEGLKKINVDKIMRDYFAKVNR